jgi:hypothetical protein
LPIILPSTGNLSHSRTLCNTYNFFMIGMGTVVDPIPNLHAGGPPLVSCPQLRFSVFANVLLIWSLDHSSRTWGCTMLW